MVENGPVLACRLDALDVAQRERRSILASRLAAQLIGIKELPDGYGLRFPGEPALCLEAAEFITLESRCCPFFRFELEVEPNGGPLWLRLTGGEGVKQFLEANSQLVKGRRP